MIVSRDLLERSLRIVSFGALIIAALPVRSLNRMIPFVSQSATIIAGRVTDSAGTRPLAGALVTARGSKDAATIAADAEGRFTFYGLEPGSYRVIASKPGYVASEFGARGPGREGAAVLVAPRQRKDLELRLAKGAVIAGAVFDVSGRRAPRQYVSVLQRKMTEGGRRLTPVAALSATMGLKGPVTDDQGQYRLFGLPAGEYLVVVNWQAGSETWRSEASSSDIQLATQLIQNPLMQMPAGQSPPAGPLNGREAVMAAPVYYPGTLIPQQSQTLNLQPGQEIDDVDVHLLFARPVSIDVSVASPDGQAMPDVIVQVVSNETEAGLRVTPNSRSVDGGNVRFAGLTPGRYVVEAMTRPGPNATQGLRLGSTEVELDGSGPVEVKVPLPLGARISGHTSLEDGQQVTEPLEIRIEPDHVVPRSWRRSLSTTSRLGVFEIDNVPPGKYRIGFGDVHLDQDLQLVSVKLGERQVSDQLVEVMSGQALDLLTLVITRRHTELFGRLEDPQGRPAADYSVLVFPRDRSRWFWRAPAVRTQRLGSDGAYSIVGLPPGEYYLAVATDLEPGEWYDPAVLEQFVSSALSVSVVAGTKTEQSLRIVR